MNIIQQCIQSGYFAPLSFIKMKKYSFIWMSVYFSLGLVVFSGLFYLLLTHQDAIKQLLLDYFFPTSWHSISEKFLNFFYESQTKTVIGNLIISGSLVVASIFLFPVKEQFSSHFEKEGQYLNGTRHEFPLLYQAWEETRLLFIYITAQSVILWIGYYPFFWAKVSSITLSYLFLFFSFGLDFIAPTLQRHRIKYSLMLKVLFKKPFLVLIFGALFSAPIILLSHYIFLNENLTLVDATGILFLSNLLFLTLAIPAGTHLASKLMPLFATTRPPTGRSVTLGYTIMTILFCCGLYLHGSLATSLHHKSQILKAEYSIDWDSIDYSLPSFSELLDGEALSKLSFDLEITNNTEFDIVIEKSQLTVEKYQDQIAAIDLNHFEVPSNTTRRVNIKLDSISNLGKISELNKILKGWRIDLNIQIWPSIPFIVNLYSDEPENEKH